MRSFVRPAAISPHSSSTAVVLLWITGLYRRLIPVQDSLRVACHDITARSQPPTSRRSSSRPQSPSRCLPSPRPPSLLIPSVEKDRGGACPLLIFFSISRERPKHAPLLLYSPRGRYPEHYEKNALKGKPNRWPVALCSASKGESDGYLVTRRCWSCRLARVRDRCQLASWTFSGVGARSDLVPLPL